MSYIKKSRDYLSNGRIQDCINNLKEHVKDEYILNQILQLEIRYNTLKRRITSGTINLNDAQLEENRISNPLLMIISNLAKEKKPSIPIPPSFKWIIIGLLGLSLLGVGIYFIIDSAGEPPNPCEKITCQNNGRCNDGKCKCPRGYSGQYCQIKDNPNERKPDLKITGFQMKPTVPIEGERISMQAIVKNIGNNKSGNFNIKWWAGINFPGPAYQKDFSGLKAGEQKVFSFRYDGYKSWYGTITSKLEIDSENSVKESDEDNNILTKSYAVKKK